MELLHERCAGRRLELEQRTEAIQRSGSEKLVDRAAGAVRDNDIAPDEALIGTLFFARNPTS